MFQHPQCLIYSVMFCWHLTVIRGCKHAKLPSAAVKYIWLLKPLLSLRSRKLSKLNKVIKLSRQSSTHAAQALKSGVQGPSLCVHAHTHTHTHFNALSVSDELNLIYTGLRYYRGSTWGHLRIQTYCLHCRALLLITADTAGHSVLFGRARNLTHSEVKTQRHTQHSNTHMQTHTNELRHIHNAPTLPVTHSHCLIYFCVSS